MYRYTNSGPASLQVTERPLYGSGRVGSYAEAQQLLPATAVPANYVHPMLPAHTRYELADHLGNVRATVSGQLLPGNNAGSPYQPELVSAQGYEPFGSLLPGRNYSSTTDTYRYGFQGQESDGEINGERNSYAFEYRIHDPRVGRFLSIDPLSRKYPFYTPYSFSGNRVIDSREIEGLEPRQEIYGPDKLVPVLVVPASSTIQVPIHPGGLDYLKDKGPTPSPPMTWRQKAQLADLVLPIEFWSNVLDGENLDGSKATFGGAMLNTLGIIPIPGFKQMGLLRRAKFGDEFIDIVERTVKNSNGDDVTRSFVKHEDDLLKIADDAAGGSLDNFKEIKPGFYEGEVNGVRRKIEWQPGGEPHMGHGPHVKVMDWNPKAGKTKADGTPAGKWEVKSRYELDSE
ncbi:MAG: hypothetical protein KJZ58_13960 [Flavobacteriales bacterium]|nr:hypothetical protein [Flavobacteriales bacterium]